jgi:hypothetical protein
MEKLVLSSRRDIDDGRRLESGGLHRQNQAHLAEIGQSATPAMRTRA